MELNQQKKRFWRFALVMVLLFWAFLPTPGVKDASDNPDQEELIGPGWNITGQREARKAFPRNCCGTETLVYMVYSDGNVDVYDYSGAYQYTIQIWDDLLNGGVSGRCFDDLLAVKSKSHKVMLFRGTEMVERISYDEARSRGIIIHDSDRNSPFRITQEAVEKQVGEDWVKLFPLPEEIRANLSRMPVHQEINGVAADVFLVLFFLGAGLFLFFWFRNIWEMLRDYWKWRKK